MQRIIGVTELQRRFRSVFDEVAKNHVPYVLTRGSRPEAVLIPYQEFLVGDEDRFWPAATGQNVRDVVLGHFVKHGTEAALQLSYANDSLHGHLICSRNMYSATYYTTDLEPLSTNSQRISEWIGVAESLAYSFHHSLTAGSLSELCWPCS